MSGPLQLLDKTPEANCQSVGDYLAAWAGQNTARLRVAALVEAVLDGAKTFSATIAAGAIAGDPGELIGYNTDGDMQKAIDVASHELFLNLLKASGAAQVLSEEAQQPSFFEDHGLGVAIDPLDGSGNVATGAPVGTLFSIIPFQKGEDPFLKCGREQVAAGYVSFGNSVDLGFSVGDGLILATLSDETGEFVVVRKRVTIERETSSLAYNASVYRHMRPAIRSYVDDCLSGKEGTRQRDFNMRWIGAAVGDLHRIILKGGLFFYAGDDRPGYENGRLRHVYEANPVAFLMQAADGKATDGTIDILDKPPASHHGRTPLIFGSAAEVDVLSQYCSNPLYA
ncbi:class 1 fructose-bisphosphatase (plasmid) [Agrobacterium salinitolerans]|uniref:Fructose-1,6-bisphosphatase class 1 n=1 Tax=Agrobacterium salinitolerans TaxID=1183413 RepID=A0A4Z1R0F7_9HYPH|nr:MULTISPECIES: class 1 fructose-bisphosphatase [Agrobacterium]MDH6298087.1 fructose-1,6-bisphosphatase I [Agrobacterium fabrum]UYZ11096.1 class 1 fructose-bisphosphatase [Agrobacterium salinitolerans]